MDNGTVVGSWTGLNTNIVYMNWYEPSPTVSFKFIAGKDPAYPKPLHRQIIAGYYESTANVSTWLSSLAVAEAAGVRGVIGFMYTTYANGDDGGSGRYNDLEAVSTLCRNAGRWANTPFP
jgi:hypothetical protein